MKNEVLIFGHKNPDTDSICSSIVHEILDKKNGWETKAVRLGNINKETQYVLDYLKIEAPELIEKVEEGQEVLLVDHNEFNQSVEGIEKTKILGVTDHHRIANFETSEPIYYIAKPYGCTSTILLEEFKRQNHSIERKEAILMASAIISAVRNEHEYTICQEEPKNDCCIYDTLKGMPVAMAYVPWQEFKDLYPIEKALCRGTIFQELDKPFLGKGGCCK